MKEFAHMRSITSSRVRASGWGVSWHTDTGLDVTLGVRKLTQTVLGFVRKHELLRAGDRVGAAVSGGADSVGLLRILLELRPELGIVLFVVHLNHKLRGEESDADERFVRDLAAAHGVEIVCQSRDASAYAAGKKLSLEAAAREVRYEFFREVLGDLDRIATAHTLDDQAETVSMKLARGAGTRGLAGIYPEIAIPHSAFSTQHSAKAIVRPLLGVRRERLIEYLGEIGQAWREDSSNRDLRYTRNRVRHGILPRLEENVNPAVREALAEAAEIARGEEEYWAAEIARLLPLVWSRTERGGGLRCDGLAEVGLAVRRRLVRAAAEALGLNLEFQQVAEMLDLTAEGERASLCAGWVVVRKQGELRFEVTSGAPSDYRYELSVPGEVRVSEAGVTVQALRVESGSEGYNPEHLLDGKHAHENLVVRNWRAGERFWPAHTKEPKKIKELLQDRHITGDEKKLWPVVASEDQVVWVRGLGVRRDLLARGGAGVLIQISAIG
jgi:tRNA(Ile)-lysidine synthase